MDDTEKKKRGIRLRMSNNAYVYAIKVDNVVRYIGKGTNGRAHTHLVLVERILAGERPRGARNVHHKLADARRGGASITVKIIRRGLTDQQAYVAEKIIIADWHLRKPGQLWNVSAGGYGYPRALSPEHAMLMQKRHAEAMRRLITDPRYHQKLSAGHIRQWARPGAREERGALMQQHWQNSTYCERQSISRSAAWTPKRHAKHQKHLKERWDDLQAREHHGIQLKANWQALTPEEREARRLTMMEVANRPEILAAKSAYAKQHWSKKANRRAQADKMQKRWADPEYKSRLREAHLRRWAARKTVEKRG